MKAKTKTAWHRCNDNHAKARTSQGTTTRQSIAQDYNRGTLIAAVIMSLFFGAAILMWAVVSV